MILPQTVGNIIIGFDNNNKNFFAPPANAYVPAMLNKIISHSIFDVHRER